jgi:outer membrane receptor protein involved in Fe transport
MKNVQTCGRALKLGVAVGALILAGANPAFAQGSGAEPSEGVVQDGDQSDGASDQGSGIVVTGTRVKRDGFSAPTPETVLSALEIQTSAPANIANFVNQLPQAAPSDTPRTNTVQVGTGTAGSNFLNLRSLGAARTLVLLDGRRMVGASTEGLVDVNTLPSSLISRIDVVTGGASAAYGSDAVAGVVNFVLDTKFKGLKLSAQNGITTYGDGYNWKADIAAGTDFAGGRGHILVSGMISKDEGIGESRSRPWFNGQKIIPNPVTGAGQPTQIAAENVKLSRSTLGGIIVSGVLRGTEFGPGGAVSQHQYGTVSGIFQIGGTGLDLAEYYGLSTPVEQRTAFARLSYDFSDAFNVFAEGSYGYALARPFSPFNSYMGNLTLRSDNGFLPDDLRTILTAAGPTFSFGTSNGDIGRYDTRNRRELFRGVLGAQGEIGGGWSYELYGQYGRTDISISAGNNVNMAVFRQATDAVRLPSGQVVCRSTLTNPNDGCIAYNPFGTGVNSPEAIAYVTGTSRTDSVLEQKVVAGTIQGMPFDTWAGPVSIVVGGEYRSEEISGTGDPVSAVSGYQAGNYKATNGKYDVHEFFGEVVVPLAKDIPAIYELEFNGAARRTHYSTSGSVTTWKAGLTYSPIRDLRLRATRSRDIRAPNLSNLFLGGTVQNNQTARDPFTNGSSPLFRLTTQGNPDLTPEIADTLTVGGVYTPGWLPGLSLSVDYYDIKIKDALSVLTPQQILDRCFGGNTALCGNITRTGGVVTAITTSPFNVAVERARGLDIEASYRRQLGNGGNLNLRVLGTHAITRYVFDGTNTDYSDGENSGSLPRWRVRTSVGYSDEKLRADVTARTVSSGVYDRAFTPAILADNRIPGATYFDLALGFKVPAFTADGEGEFFINVDNVFNKDPVLVLPTNLQQITAPVNAALYDTVGREFRIGFRVKI